MANTKIPPGTDLTYLPIEQLKIHPKNLRHYYPAADVQEMAASIQAVGGVIQALQIVPAGQFTEDRMPLFYVVDGNMRLAAARTLDDCPPLKCEQISSSEAEQLLLMAVTSQFHYPKDPISKARHYRRLVEEEGITPPQIAELTGLSQSTIYNHLSLLELTSERAQHLIGEGKLSADIALHRALQRIPDDAKRAELIERYAARGLSGKSALKSTRYVLKQYELLSQQPVGALNGNGKIAPPVVAAPRPKQNNYPDRINKSNGFSAEKVAAIAAVNLCPGCRLDGLTSKCYTCPSPYEFINHLVDVLPQSALDQAVGDEVKVAA